MPRTIDLEELQASLFAELVSGSGETGGELAPWPYMLMGYDVPRDAVSFQQFWGVHAKQLEQAGLPHKLWSKLYQKLRAQAFDAGESFGLTEDHELLALSDMPAESDVWLIDHAWTTTPQFARHQVSVVMSS